ncbi:TetR/AcrR family transcriptional regulator [Halieaceae bacterium IMCC14734]|uniref:TetR/AcrR family transcriptional regulator n=1 Tax=Candidatus Litorirhabdus singularis TaxID=2518993 RepID=A0ABT3TPK6_9GAMM|nr:TetR/AcrR family transcriptional regulator [Candidatus Litorirhabdus singularis]MCX2983267.1 TetR/AcrR family transcriptional regulator [Candidatus Litorirhabdus singularis]
MTDSKDSTGKTGGSPFNRTAQHDAKRSAILSQAARLFNGRGSRSTTLLDIAQSLGLTKTSLYYYVKTKEELIYQCYVAALDHLNAGLDAIESKQSSGLDRVTAVLHAHFIDWREAQLGHRNHTAALLEIASLGDVHRADVEQRYTAMFLRIRQYIRDGIAEGSIRDCESTATTLGLIGSMQWSFNWLRTVPIEQIDDIARAACDLVTNGLSSGEQAYRFRDFSFPKLAAENPQGFNREEQNRLKQEAFHKTGTWFFNKKGFAGTSLDEIAETLHVTKGAFYYHIKSKEDLLYSCYQRSLAISETLRRDADNLNRGIERLDYVCRGTFTIQNSDDGPMIRYNTITALPIERRKKILALTDKGNDEFGGFMRDGITDGSVRSINVEVAQQLISGAINASMDLPTWRNIEDVNQASIDFYDCLFSGLKPR